MLVKTECDLCRKEFQYNTGYWSGRNNYRESRQEHYRQSHPERDRYCQDIVAMAEVGTSISELAQILHCSKNYITTLVHELINDGEIEFDINWDITLPDINLDIFG